MSSKNLNFLSQNGRRSVLDLVNNLSREGEFLSEKISESIAKHQLEFQNDGCTRDKVKSLNKNHLLIEFLGNEIVDKITEKYNPE